MGRAIELITGLTTAPGAAFTAATVLTGNSFTIRDTKKKARMVAQWDTRQGAGITRINSVLMHDSTIGMQHGADAAQTRSTILIPEQELVAQDNLQVSMTGSAVAGDIEHMSFLVEYDDLPGVSGRFITESDLLKKMVNRFSNTITIATGVSGLYTGQVAVNSAEDQFKANTDYALLGFNVVDAGVHAIRYIGPDWGNIGIGGPGAAAGFIHDGSDWFAKLSRETGRAFIPVMNSANRALTMIDAATDENGVNPVVISMWAELS